MVTTQSGNAASAGTQAVERALAILQCLAGDVEDLGVSTIGKHVGLSPSTVHRLLGALTRMGYVQQNPATGRYLLGRAAFVLGQSAQRRLGLDLVQERIEGLSRAVEESVNLGVRFGDEAVVMLRVESRQPLRYDQPVGSHVPLHASALGKALIGFADDLDAQLEHLQPLPALTSHTITNLVALGEHLRETRLRGYSVDDEEGLLGVRCVGAPVFNHHGQVSAAIAIQVPAVRMPDKRRQELGELVVLCAAEIQDILPANGWL